MLKSNPTLEMQLYWKWWVFRLGLLNTGFLEYRVFGVKKYIGTEDALKRKGDIIICMRKMQDDFPGLISDYGGH